VTDRGALVCRAVLSGWAKQLARSAEPTSGGLEVLEDVLDEPGLGGRALPAAHEVAAESSGTVPPDLEAATSRDDRVLLGLHRLMEEGGVGGGHVLHWGHDGWELRVVLWDIAT